MPADQLDILIIGAGAAGLAAAVFAGEAAAGRSLRLAIVDGATKPGAKILVSGGARCNVTHRQVTEDDFWGGPRPLIRRVLRVFDHTHTLGWMRSLGVELKLEDTGKYFPVTDRSRTVLEALLRRVDELGVTLHRDARVLEIQPLDSHTVAGLTPARSAAQAVEGVARSVAAGQAGSTPNEDGGWRVTFRDREPLMARRLIVATGGLALPKSGSDGWGLEALRSLGHTIIQPTPALAPLVCDADQPGPGGQFADFSGITLDVRLGLFDDRDRRLEERHGSLVFTHFGISGPAALDLSRHWLRARLERPDRPLQVRLAIPGLVSFESADRWLQDQAQSSPRRDVATALRAWLPERLARAYVEGQPNLANLGKSARRQLAHWLTGLPLRVTHDRGYAHAETTAGGVDLREIDMSTMASKRLRHLHLAGEVCDVDGRLGGFNFTWAWASGFLAGRGAVASLGIEPRNVSWTRHD